MPAGEFKAKCLQLMDEVNRLHQEIIITKHGKPIARLVPYEEHPPSLFGYMKGSVELSGDILAPVEESWYADE
jgi:prevent-host-death family protein